jgi:threonine synthase
MIYSQGIFEGVFDGFDAPEVLPVVKVGPVHVAEAWHGPTGVFKDLTLHVLARLSDHFLEKRGQRATILVSTTGDTGGTTIRSVRGMKNLRAIVAYPRHTVSRVQELQMTTTGSENAVVFSHDGISDDLDLILRNIFRDGELRKRHTLLSFNSIHTVRVLLNIVHFVYVYLRVAPKADRSVLVSVPTGGVGNAAGGVMAAEMGVPIKILSAVNENDVVHRAFTLGDFSIARAQIPTHAPSLDSNLPHNVERVFYFALNGDTAALKRVMEDFEQTQKSVLPGEICEGFRHFLTASVNKEQCLETMKSVWEEFGYAVCPHTAVAWKPAAEYASQNGLGSGVVKGGETGPPAERCKVVVVFSTASPAKFPETLSLVSVPVPPAAWVTELAGKKERKLFLDKGEDWEGILRETIASSQGFL